MAALTIKLPSHRLSGGSVADDEKSPNTQGSSPQLEDLWVVENLLGRGGFASVRACTRKSDGLRAAVKLLPCSSLRSRKLRRQLAREIGVLRFISEEPDLARNDHIMHLHQLFQSPDRTCLVVELCEGGELFDRVAEAGHLSERAAAGALAQLVRAVHALHAHGVLHRDLKPENCLYTSKSPDAILKLADFGLSCRRDSEGATDSGDHDHWHMMHEHSLVCSPGYCSPEVLKSRDYGPPCDLWGLGVILYILLSGFMPFSAESSEKTFRLIRDAAPAFPPSQGWSEVSSSGRQLVEGLLRKDPEARLTASEVLASPFISSHETQCKAHRPSAHQAFVRHNRERKSRMSAGFLHIGSKLGRAQELHRILSQKGDDEYLTSNSTGRDSSDKPYMTGGAAAAAEWEESRDDSDQTTDSSVEANRRSSFSPKRSSFSGKLDSTAVTLAKLESLRGSFSALNMDSPTSAHLLSGRPSSRKWNASSGSTAHAAVSESPTGKRSSEARPRGSSLWPEAPRVGIGEFREALRGAGLSDLPADDLFRLFDDGTRSLDRSAFLGSMASVQLAMHAREQQDQASGDSVATKADGCSTRERTARFLFGLFDRDNDGFLDRDELSELLHVVGDHAGAAHENGDHHLRNDALRLGAAFGGVLNSSKNGLISWEAFRHELSSGGTNGLAGALLFGDSGGTFRLSASSQNRKSRGPVKRRRKGAMGE